MAISRSHRPGFFLSLFQPRTSVTIPRTRAVRPWYGHWHPSLKYLRKKNGLTDCGMATDVKKKNSLWDRGMAIDVRVQNVFGKKTKWSDRPWCGHWGYSILYGHWRVNYTQTCFSLFLTRSLVSDITHNWLGTFSSLVFRFRLSTNSLTSIREFYSAPWYYVGVHCGQKAIWKRAPQNWDSL